VVCGGDDLTLILRARDALPFTECYLAAFERRTQERMREARLADHAFTACAGIAFVKPGWPFSQACRLAEELCGAAKRRLDDGRGGQTPSGFLFHRVTTALAASWHEIEEHELAAGPDRRNRLVGGPYVVGEPLAGAISVAQFQILARAAQALPRSSTREWLRIVRSDPFRAEVHYRRAMDVLRADRQKACDEWERALEECGCDPRTGWNPNRNPIATPLLDVVTWRSVDPDVTLWRDG